MATRYTTQDQLNQQAARMATEAQMAVFAKMAAMGWKVLKMVGHSDKAAINLSLKGTSVWLTPSGEVVRPKAGCKTAYINTQTLEAA